MAMKKSKTAAKTPVMTDKEKKEYLASVAIMPSTNAAAVIESFSKGAFGEQDINELVEQLRTKFVEVENGDLKRCESMLIGQAHALQSIFVNLARRSALNLGDYMDASERYLRLALKAQNQCRATLETLATIKNPPVVFAKQANINQGNGNQQVNNGTTVSASHAEKNIYQPNELLEVQHGGTTLDNRTKGATIGKDKAMAALDEIDRGAYPRR